MITNGEAQQPRRGCRSFSKLTLCRRKYANGVVPGPVTTVSNAANSEAVLNSKKYCVSYTMGRKSTNVVEYLPCALRDLFQIGRCASPVIDFVVGDSEPELPLRAPFKAPARPSNGRHLFRLRDRTISATAPVPKPTRSTVSRFACRIDVERHPPHKTRIYAAGFDNQHNIFLGEQAIKWHHDSTIDGFTTNGVRILRPSARRSNGDGSGSVSDQHAEFDWREVSVCGYIYRLHSSLVVPEKTDRLSEDNVLEDGTLIDLSGSILLWRSAASLRLALNLDELYSMVDIINQTNIQCPVLYKTLRFNENASSTTAYSDPGRNLCTSTLANRQPFVYLNCGHVHGWHSWLLGSNLERDGDERICPLCRCPSRFVALTLGVETGFFVDRGPPTHCFNPCGHFASEATVQYWCNLKLPDFLAGKTTSCCPFCGVQVEASPVRLFLQHSADEETLRAAFGLFQNPPDMLLEEQTYSYNSSNPPLVAAILSVEDLDEDADDEDYSHTVTDINSK